MVDRRFRVAHISKFMLAELDNLPASLRFHLMALLDVDQMNVMNEDFIVCLAQEFDQALGAVDTTAKHHQGGLGAASSSDIVIPVFCHPAIAYA